MCPKNLGYKWHKCNCVQLYALRKQQLVLTTALRQRQVARLHAAKAAFQQITSNLAVSAEMVKHVETWNRHEVSYNRGTARSSISNDGIVHDQLVNHPAIGGSPISVEIPIDLPKMSPIFPKWNQQCIVLAVRSHMSTLSLFKQMEPSELQKAFTHTMTIGYPKFSNNSMA